MGVLLLALAKSIYYKMLTILHVRWHKKIQNTLYVTNTWVKIWIRHTLETFMESTNKQGALGISAKPSDFW